MGDEAIARLKILSTVRTAEEITKTLGIACDRCWRKGDTRAKTSIIEQKNGWILDSGMPRSAALSTQIESLLARLFPRAAEIKLLSRDDEVELSCVVYAASPPALNFTHPILHQLSEMGASLDIDLYILD